MFSRSGKLGKRKPQGQNNNNPSSTLAIPESPEILCNPFCLPSSPVLVREGALDGPHLSLSKHLICELPDIYLVPPNDDPLKVAICVWDSKTDGILSTFLDSSPSTPVASPQFERHGRDWISLASTYKKIEDGQRDLPMFRRPSNDDIQSHSVIMPIPFPLTSTTSSLDEMISYTLKVDIDTHRSSLVSQFPRPAPARHLTLDRDSNVPQIFLPQFTFSPTTGEEYFGMQDQSVDSMRSVPSPLAPMSDIANVVAGNAFIQHRGIGPPPGLAEQSASDDTESNPFPPRREARLKTEIPPTSECIQARVMLKDVSSQMGALSQEPVPLNTGVCATHMAANVNIESPSYVPANAPLPQQALSLQPPFVTACTHIDKALPSIPFQLPQLSFLVDPVELFIGPSGWVTAPGSLGSVGGGDPGADSNDAVPSQLLGLPPETAVLPPNHIHNTTVIGKISHPPLGPNNEDNTDAVAFPMLTGLESWLSRERMYSTPSSGLLASLEEVAAGVQCLNLLKPSSSMRLLPPSSPLLPPLEFDPYGFAGDFNTYLYLRTSRSCRSSGTRR